MKRFLLLGSMAIVAVFSTTIDIAAAACAYPGYINSEGRCVVSYSTSYTTATPLRNYSYATSYGTYGQQQYLLNYIAQLQQLLAQLEALQAQQNNYVLSYPPRPTGDSRVDVTTESATDIEDDEARLRGELDFNREDEATVYFEWGESRTRLNERTTRVVLDEDDDNEDFSQVITRLDEDETYYFRAVAEDERGRRDYGSIRSFTTDDDRRDRNRNDDEPDVETGDAEDIDDDSAEIYGEVDMNDFDNGLAFFVYGEDEDLVDDIARDYDEYDDIDEEGDDLQKVFVDSNVDNRFDAWADLFGLDDDTRYYYAFCVEFNDEDNDEMIICGDTEDFRTDD